MVGKLRRAAGQHRTDATLLDMVGAVRHDLNRLGGHSEETLFSSPLTHSFISILLRFWKRSSWCQRLRSSTDSIVNCPGRCVAQEFIRFRETHRALVANTVTDQAAILGTVTVGTHDRPGTQMQLQCRRSQHDTKCEVM